MSQMKDGQGYHGSCRNATLAVWGARDQHFTYVREKFLQISLAGVAHREDPERGEGVDGFTPEREASDAEVMLDFGGLILCTMRSRNKDEV